MRTMRLIGLWNFYDGLNGAMITQRNAPIGDDLLLPFNVLAQTAPKHGITLVPIDASVDLTRLDGVLFLDFPDLRNPVAAQALAASGEKYLFTFEPPVVRMANWRDTTHAYFNKVFTWDDDLIASDTQKFVKVNYAAALPATPAPRNVRPRLCAIFASAKTSPHPRERYSWRAEAVRWFQQHHPSDLDLYGPGWGPQTEPVYKGFVPPGRKREVLQNYRFAIVYENGEFPGYISEKIMDCFLAGTVPVYLGAPNVTRWIPPDCFIDARDYILRTHDGVSYETLYRDLTHMDECDYAMLRQRIDQFVGTDASAAFSIKTFVNTMVSHLL
jgi:hypothetical protein